MMKVAVFIAQVLLFNVISASIEPGLPQQVHISSTGIDAGIVVTWITFYPTTSSQVKYAVHGNKTLDKNANGAMISYTNGDITRYVHRVTVQDLQPSTVYDYQCGSPSNWSTTIYQMKTIANVSNYSPRFLVYGDFGYSNAQSMTRIQQQVDSGTIDAILHVGDMAYNLDSSSGNNGDDFMRMIEPVASRLPYMTLPGNHESANNFEEYRNRFSMPGGHDSIYYSWNIGPAHIVMFSTEVYFYVQYGLDPIKEQYEWLQKDLQQATTPESLAVRPWIITMAHRPMYCSTTDGDDCDKEKSIVRGGLPVIHSYPLESLFHEHGVDLCVWAHEHNYERLWPIYDGKVMNGSHEHPYSNPKASVHVITGSAGCSERHDAFTKNQPEWVAYTSNDYGFTRMTVHNKTHLTMEQISDDQNGKIVDSFTIIKTDQA